MWQYVLYGLGALVLGFLLDLMFGDPNISFHPIVLIGRLIGRMEKALRQVFPRSQKGEQAAGTCLAALVIFVSMATPLALLLLCYWLHPLAGFLLETVMNWFLLAAKSLKTESMRVQRELEQGGLAAGRLAVARIVGRDTKELSKQGVIKAAVETVAENTSDGVTAPLIYIAIGGPVLGFFYKAVNTMDSMVGYKNEKYLHFGRAAARLDDAANYIPARLTACLMIAASFLCGFHGREAARIYRRDRRNHASPNSAQTESVMAGALGIQLAGDAWYFGKKYEKPFIGDASRTIEPKDIARADRLMYMTAFLTLVLLVLIKAAALLWIK